MMLINIGDQSLSVEPEIAFKALFDDAPNPMCIIEEHRIINCNATFVERCGFNEVEEVINKITVDEQIQFDGLDSFVEFSSLTKGKKKIGGKILLSDKMEDKFYFGFIDVQWIEGLEEFEAIVDRMNELIKNFLGPQPDNAS